jgi:hypothetical protein
MLLEVTCRHMMIQKLKTLTAQGPWVVFTFDTPIISKGGHELPHLPTNQIIVRQYVTHVPISPAIIKQVHQIAEAEEMPNGLKIKNRVNNVLYDHAWITGVDYENDEDDEKDAPFND